MRIVLMRGILAGMAAITLGAGFAAPAQAQEAPWGPAPWCLQAGNPFPNCAYYTQRQCIETGRGAYRGYTCIPNPYASRGRAVRGRRDY